MYIAEAIDNNFLPRLYTRIPQVDYTSSENSTLSVITADQIFKPSFIDSNGYYPDFNFENLVAKQKWRHFQNESQKWAKKGQN